MSDEDVSRKAAREALMDAADYLMMTDSVGPEFLIYLAVTKYGDAEFDPEVLTGMIQHPGVERLRARVTPQHRQIHRPATGDSECSCGEWEGPMTTLVEGDPRSFEVHVRERSS